MLKSKKYSQPVDIILSVLLFWFFFQLESDSSQFTFLITLSAGCFLSLLFKQVRVHLYLLIASSWLLLVMVAWNIIFRDFVLENQLSNGIYRGIFSQNLRAPLYGHIPENRSMHLLILPLLIVGVFAFLYKRILKKNLEVTGVYFVPFVFFQVVLFSWYPDSNLFENKVHYITFTEGLNYFSGVGDLMENYVARMHELGVHNSHYPPLILVLLKIEQLYIPYFAKGVIYVSLIASLVLFYAILTFTMSDKKWRLLLMTLFSAALPVLYWWVIAPDPLLLMWTLGLIYTVLRFLKGYHWKWVLACGILFYGFAMTSMLVLFIALFLFLFVSMNMLKPLMNRLWILLGVGGVIVVVFMLSLIVESVTGFDILVCYLKGADQAFGLMVEKEGWAGFFLRGAGNLLGFIFIAFIPMLLLIRGKGGYNFLVIFFLLVMAFSGVFYLETERVWLFAFPLVLLFSTPHPLLKKRAVYLVSLQLLLSMLLLVNFVFHA